MIKSSYSQISSNKIIWLVDIFSYRWHEFRTLCDSQRRINVVLELSTNLPEEEVLDRWLAEPIKCVMVSTNLFLTNKRGYPVLSKPHQNFLKKLFRVLICLILTYAHDFLDHICYGILYCTS